MENEDDLAYRKVVEKYRDIENDFYSNNSPNDNLESRF